MSVSDLQWNPCEELDRVVHHAVTRTVDATHTPDVGVSLLRFDADDASVRVGGHRADQPMYPASVVKLFYLAYSAFLADTDPGLRTEEFDRAALDMIAISSNDATALVLDTLTDTTGGPEISDYELGFWMERRQAVNRWLRGRGYEEVNACQKTWNEAPYGREKQGYGSNSRLTNSINPQSAARLMAEIVTGRIASIDQTNWMLSTLRRQTVADGEQTDMQSTNFTGKVLPRGTKLWSKAGYMSTARHDVAYFELPNADRYVLAIFTQHQSDQLSLIPSLAAEILLGLGVTPHAS